VLNYNLITNIKLKIGVRQVTELFSTKNEIFHIVAKGHGSSFTSMRTHLDNYLPVAIISRFAESTINRYYGGMVFVNFSCYFLVVQPSTT